MTPEQLDTEIAAILAMRGGCDCSLRESCERCSSYGPAVRMEEALRELRRKVRGEPEPPPPDYGASVEIPWRVLVGPPIYTTREELARWEWSTT